MDQDGEVVDVYLQGKRDGGTAKRFFRRLLRSHGTEPRKIVTDKLRSYGVAHRELMPETIHSTEQYENNRAEQSHESTRVRARGMGRFKSVGQAQLFLGAHAAMNASSHSVEGAGTVARRRLGPTIVVSSTKGTSGRTRPVFKFASRRPVNTPATPDISAIVLRLKSRAASGTVENAVLPST